MKHTNEVLKKLFGEDHPFVQLSEAMDRDFEEEVARNRAESEKRRKEMDEEFERRKAEMFRRRY